MSPIIQQMTAHHVPYTPRTDAIARNDYGITRNRKAASTGGGRAWSEDEEAYLLQTRLQKMPYKHIAAQLKKTELACRLHYHQLSHGSNRRKRTASASSVSSNSSHSPVLQTSMPSPVREHGGAASRSVSPLDSIYRPNSQSGIQLPNIMSAAGRSNDSPRLPTILPKPASMCIAQASTTTPSGSTGTASPTASRGCPTPFHDSHPHTGAPAKSAGYLDADNPSTRGSGTGASHHGHGRENLRLDCSALPPPPSDNGLSAAPGLMASHPVDMARLAAAYNAHRASFWAAVAAEYGPGANPRVLEQVWRGLPTGNYTNPDSSSSSSGGGGGGGGNSPCAGAPGTGSIANWAGAAPIPITPVASPEDQAYAVCGGSYHGKPDRTRISAILGIDASPKSSGEREMVRRMEEGREAVGLEMA
ncbi:hypothetical protein VTH06DRAFT_4711 [Thermothelomyces fergusii]